MITLLATVIAVLVTLTNIMGISSAPLGQVWGVTAAFWLLALLWWGIRWANRQ